MATLTVRNIPDDAKHRFRQVAAAHGRSMEEHLRQLVIDVDFGEAPGFASGVADVQRSFQHEPSSRGTAQAAARAVRIRAMSSAEFFKHLSELAGGVGLELPPRANLPEDREVFGAD